jgi:hypothetical protein
MINLAIQLLWVLIGIIIICGIIWLVLYGIKNIAGVPVPARVEQGVWFIVLILILIGILSVLAGGSFHSLRLGHTHSNLSQLSYVHYHYYSLGS